jgi:hypothetical protein
MVPVTLEQRNGFERKIFTLEAEYINIIEKKLGERKEYKVRYDQLGFDMMTKVDAKTAYAPYIFGSFVVLFLVGFISSIANPQPDSVRIAVILVICAVFFSVLLVLSWFDRRKEYTYMGGGERTLELFSKKPDREIVAQFVDEIFSRMRSEHLERYQERFDEIYSIEAHHQWLDYLLKIKAISKEEKKEYLARARSNSNVIGFDTSEN